jgi:hypothetical protein
VTPIDPLEPAGRAEAPVARDKFRCEACGAEAHWNPAKQALVCPFCGTESAAPLQVRAAGTIIAEHDLAAALRGPAAAAPRGGFAGKAAARCQSCQAISVFDAAQVGRRCDFCGSAQLVPYEQLQETVTPQSLLPMMLSEAQARDVIRAWYRRQWLAPNALGRRALTDTARGVYLPYWAFDARADARWTAQAGTYYHVRVNGKRVRQVRWTPAAGELSHVFDDDLVPGSTGVDRALLRRIEPFPTGSLIPYDPGYLAGWTVERYQLDLAAAAAAARHQMDATLRDLCARQVPGDTHRNLDVQATFSDERFKHLLVPIWLLTYRYGPRSYQVVVNGVTGAAAGTHPWSWVKITLLVIVALIVAYLIAASN